MKTVGIIGLGFVGSAIKESFSDTYNVKIVDNDTSKATHSIYSLNDCEVIFVCVPTPQSEDGECNTSILESILTRLEYYKGPIISKCTAPPSFYKEKGSVYNNLIHAPEFLTAANAKEDYKNGTFAILGGTSKEHLDKASFVIRDSQKNLESIVFCSLEEAALAKYSINTFLATKVLFMNEIYKLCDKVGINYNVVSELIKLDSRIGTSHMKVPGNDGFGFAGMCFPKDTSALYHYGKLEGYDMELLGNVIRINKEFRSK